MTFSAADALLQYYLSVGSETGLILTQHAVRSGCHAPIVSLCASLCGFGCPQVVWNSEGDSLLSRRSSLFLTDSLSG